MSLSQFPIGLTIHGVKETSGRFSTVSANMQRCHACAAGVPVQTTVRRPVIHDGEVKTIMISPEQCAALAPEQCAALDMYVSRSGIKAPMRRRPRCIAKRIAARDGRMHFAIDAKTIKPVCLAKNRLDATP